MNKIKNGLKEVQPGSLHFIMDIWTSKQKMSILEIQVQYIHNWKMKRITIGFRHFPESHTAENIQKTLHDFLLVEMGLTHSQVLFIF